MLFYIYGDLHPKWVSVGANQGVSRVVFILKARRRTHSLTLPEMPVSFGSWPLPSSLRPALPQLSTSLRLLCLTIPLLGTLVTLGPPGRSKVILPSQCLYVNHTCKTPSSCKVTYSQVSGVQIWPSTGHHVLSCCPAYHSNHIMGGCTSQICQHWGQVPPFFSRVLQITGRKVPLWGVPPTH